MKRSTRTLLWIIPFLVVGTGFFYRFWWLPKHHISQIANEQKSNLYNLGLSLQRSAELMLALPAPDTVNLSKIDVKSYADRAVQSANSLGTLNVNLTTSFQKSGTTSNALNLLLQEPGYKQAITDASATLADSRAFLAHHGGVMEALANFFGYNATDDLSPTNLDTLSINLGYTVQGLQTTLNRIKAAPAYHNDKTLDEVLSSLGTVQAACQNALEDLKSGNAAINRNMIIETVDSAKRNIVSNRTLFWYGQSKSLVESAKNTQAKLEPYVQRLQAID